MNILCKSWEDFKVLDDFAHCKIWQRHWHLPQPLIQAQLNIVFKPIGKCAFALSVLSPEAHYIFHTARCCVLHIWWFCRQEDGFLHKIIGRSWKALNIVAWPIFTLEWPLVPCSACIRDSREPCHTYFTLHRKWETHMSILRQLYSLPIAELPYANWVNLCDIMVSKWLIQ